ncbi:MAG: hypothetical protein JXR80_06285 [Deltaproteobacteria bacterium]|nr:hypothetical protein [Deltaproteobacteria bacterium]
MKRVALLAFFFYLAAVGLSYSLQTRFKNPLRDDLRLEPPTSQALAYLSLDHRGFLADILFIRAIQHAGSLLWKPLNFSLDSPWKYALMERVTELDPLYYNAYLFSGMGLIQDFDDILLARPILERGLKNFPESWELPFWLGYDFYLYQNDYATASRYLLMAAEKPNAPRSFFALLLKTLNQQGAYHQAQALMSKMAASQPAGSLKLLYEKKALRLQHLAQLQDAAGKFAEREKRKINNLDELVKSGLLEKIPDDPLGQGYHWSKDQGRVVAGKETN